MRKYSFLYVFLGMLLFSLSSYADEMRNQSLPFSTGYYFVINNFSFNDGGEKAIYDNFGTVSWKTLDREDCAFLWYVKYDTSTKNYQFTNCAFDRHISKSPKGAIVKLEDDLSAAINEVMITLMTTSEEHGNVVSIRSANTTDDYGFFHPKNHDNGAGLSGDIVGWRTGENPELSTWYFEAVSNEKAQELISSYEPYRARTPLLKDYHKLEGEARLALSLARDVIVTKVDKENPLITAASQFSSKNSDATEGKNFNGLLDRNVTTYWHSDWHHQPVTPGDHSFQVLFNKNIENGFAFDMIRRNSTSNDHPTKVAVYGAKSNEEPVYWNYLSTVDIPYTIDGVTNISDNVLFDGGYKYFRFQVLETNTNRGFFHMADFQMYPVTVSANSNSQYSKLGGVATNLEKVVNALPENDADVTVAIYDNLRKAHKAFMEVYVDPTPLRAALKVANQHKDHLVVGTNPGFWNSKDRQTFNGVVNTVVAYDKSGKYTKEKSAEYIKKLNAVSSTILKQANTIQEGKWYYLSFPTEAMYETYGWEKILAQKEENTDGTTKNEALFGRYVTHANLENRGTTYPVNVVVPVKIGDILLGDCFYYANESAVTSNKDQALFRFINLGDTAYAIQNKASGLYLQLGYDLTRPGRGGSIKASLQPAAVNVEAIGCGVNIVYARPYNNAFNCCLHASRDKSNLVSWISYGLGTNSGLMLTEVEDVAPDYEKTSFKMNLTKGAFQGVCYPTAIKPAEYSPCVMYTASMSATKTNTLVLTPIKESAPGEPFFLIDGDPEDYHAGTPEQEVCQFEHGNTFVSAPLQGSSLVGCFYVDSILAGSVIPSGNAFKVCTSTIASALNAAYVDAKIQPVSPGTYPGVSYEIELNPDVKNEMDEATGISDALAKVAQSGSAIYTLDGKRIATGNLNTLHKLPAGWYVINGIKVKK